MYREFGFFGRAVPDSLQEETGAPLWLNTEDPFCIVAVGVQASLAIFARKCLGSSVALGSIRMIDDWLRVKS